MTLKINIIGAGKLGQTLGRLMVMHDVGIIGGVCNTSIKSATDAVTCIGQGEPMVSLKALPEASMTLITSPDMQIQKISHMLSQLNYIKPNHIVIHCSGVLNSDVLQALASKGACVASVHPMQSFAQSSLAVENFVGTYCAIEGDPCALVKIIPIFKRLGAVVLPIKKDKKSLYHAGSVFASNYLITLAEEASFCLEKSGIDKEQAIKMVTKLMQSTLNNLQQTLSPQAALTGPLERGDLTTIEKHLDALSEFNLCLLYSCLGETTLKLTSHDEMTKQKIRQRLKAINAG